MSRKNPYHIAIRGTKELDEAFAALATLTGMTRAELLTELIQHYKDCQLSSDEALLQSALATRDLIDERLEAARRATDIVVKRGRPAKSETDLGRIAEESDPDRT